MHSEPCLDHAEMNKVPLLPVHVTSVVSKVGGGCGGRALAVPHLLQLINSRGVLGDDEVNCYATQPTAAWAGVSWPRRLRKESEDLARKFQAQAARMSSISSDMSCMACSSN